VLHYRIPILGLLVYGRSCRHLEEIEYLTLQFALRISVSEILYYYY